MFVPKGSDLGEPLRVTLASFRERGYVARLNWKWESVVIPLCNKNAKENQHSKSVTFHDVLRAFQLFITGIGTSGVALILEKWRKNRRRRDS